MAVDFNRMRYFELIEWVSLSQHATNIFRWKFDSYSMVSVKNSRNKWEKIHILRVGIYMGNYLGWIWVESQVDNYEKQARKIARGSLKFDLLTETDGTTIKMKRKKSSFSPYLSISYTLCSIVFTQLWIWILSNFLSFF
jgi:hypothetical protein